MNAFVGVRKRLPSQWVEIGAMNGGFLAIALSIASWIHVAMGGDWCDEWRMMSLRQTGYTGLKSQWVEIGAMNGGRTKPPETDGRNGWRSAPRMEGM